MYQWRKGIAQWKIGKILYLSVPFTWLMDEANKIADEWNGKAIIGGPGTMKPTYCDGFEPILFHNPCATFTTRGCPNKCAFCAVPKLEGDLKEIPDFRLAPIVCDNNFLAASKSHIRKAIDKLKQYPFVDFNQGLDARRFTPEIAEILGKLRCKVRFAFDSWRMESAVKDAIDICKEKTTKDINIYCLIGFNDNPESAQARLELVRTWGIKPNPMRFQPLDAKAKNEFVADGWTEHELRRMMRYYSRLNWLDHIPYSEYIHSVEDFNEEDQQQEFEFQLLQS